MSEQRDPFTAAVDAEVDAAMAKVRAYETEKLFRSGMGLPPL